MLPRYFDYIFVHLRHKVRLRPELSLNFFSNFRPEPDPKSPARLTIMWCQEVFKGGHGAMSPPLGRQDSIIRIESYAKVHAPSL